MTTTQTPEDIKLLELPGALSFALTTYANVYSSGALADEERAKVRDEIKAYALACVEADRKERSDAEYQNLLNQINNQD